MTHLIHVGNSFGIRIPKALIVQLGFKEDTELQLKVTQEGLLISPIQHVREGWDTAFKNARKGRKEKLLLGKNLTNEFDNDEWVW